MFSQAGINLRDSSVTALEEEQGTRVWQRQFKQYKIKNDGEHYQSAEVRRLSKHA